MNRLTPDEQVEITLARLEDLRRTGAFTPLSKLRRRFGRHESVLSRAINNCFRSGLVEVKVVKEGNRSNTRRSDLEAVLLKKYRGLVGAIVVGIDKFGRADAVDEQMLQRSDYVHRVLGQTLAHQVAHGGFIRTGDRVGIGPGRGVYETIRALQKEPQLRASDVTLVSLSGVGYMRHHAKNRNLLLDPDFIVAFMGEAFEHPVALDLVASPLVPGVGATGLQAFPTWLRLPPKDRPMLDTAILGVGIYASGNRFFEEGAALSVRLHPAYEPIRPALRALRVGSSRISSSDYVPLGDLGYHIFAIPAPGPSVPRIQIALAELQRQAESINKNLMSAHISDFSGIKSAILVAGTAAKARAIHHVLGGNLGLRVGHICTDEDAAEALAAL